MIWLICVHAVISRTLPVPVPTGCEVVFEESYPSYVTVVPEADAARTMRLFRRDQPDVTSRKLPVVMPCEPEVVATAGLALVTALTVSAAA